MLKHGLHILSFIIMCSVHFNLFAQAIKDYEHISIYFGEHTKANVIGLERTSDNQLLCIQKKTSFFSLFSKKNAKFSFDYIDNYHLPKSRPIKFFGNGNKTQLVDFSLLKNRVLGVSISTQFLKNKAQVYYHYIDPSVTTKNNHGFALEGFDFDYKKIDPSRLFLVENYNQEYATLMYFSNDRKEDFTTINYALINNNYSTTTQRTFAVPYVKNAFYPLDFIVINDSSQLFFSAHSANSQLNNILNKNKYFDKIVATQIKNDELNEWVFHLQNKYLVSAETKVNENEILISGLYTSFIDGKIEGAYFSRFDFEGKLLAEHFMPYPNHILNYINQKELEAISDNYGTTEEQKMYEVIDFIEIDNHYLLTTEFNAKEYRYGGTDAPGTTNIVDTYYWKTHILVSKFNRQGQLLWCQLVPKIQRSINDYGYHLSASTYCDTSNYHLFFNDSKANYNEEGAYNKVRELPNRAQFNTSLNTIAHIKINIKSGQMMRKSIMEREESKTIFVPQLSTSFTNTQVQMIIGRKGKKYSLGSITFR
ncbi:hypothetical protein [Brumimicrobium salinarum]|nr:hypothetical protein [Brumimicrobium salinarum]